MAHFAQLNEDNIVINVIVVSNNELLDNNVESEAKGIAFCQSLFGGTWVQTSYNRKFRRNYAGIGYSYNQEKNIFIEPMPTFPENATWWLDPNTSRWVRI